jgi:uncharacterized protein (TIRG00374 family)
MTTASAVPRKWRTVLMIGVVAGGVGLLALVERRVLTESLRTFAHLDWAWLPLAIVAEAGSMAAFARIQRRLLRAGGSTLHLGSVMAVTYAGNAISVSLPLAGAEVATAFTFRQYNRRGIDPAVAGWALAVSGIISSFAFALVLAGGAVASGNATAATLGVAGAAVALVPAVGVLAAIRYQSVRRHLDRLFARLLSISRRLVKRPGPGADGALDRLLERVTSLHLTRLQYAEVMALAIWNWVADCICLAAAIRATGTPIPWQGLFLAYCVTMTAGGIGLTPGGLGVIEATLAAALVAAGIAGRHALAAVLVYRAVSFWAVMVVGWATMILLTRRSERTAVPIPATDQ